MVDRNNTPFNIEEGGHGGGGDSRLTPGTTAGSTRINQLGGGGGGGNYPNRLVDGQPGGSGVLMIRYPYSEPVPPVQGGDHRRTGKWI